MDIKELERWIVRWYFEKWANSQLKRLRRSMFMDDRNLGHTPAARVFNRVNRDGYPLPSPPAPNDWKLTRFDHDRRTLSRKTGISYLDYHFRGPELERLIFTFGENPVDILVDPDDWRFVYVELGDELVQLVNDDTDAFSPALSFQEAKAADKEAETSSPAHPKAEQFDKDLAARSMSTGAKTAGRRKKETSKETTAKAKEHAAQERARTTPIKPKTGKDSSQSTSPNFVFDDGDGALQMTNRHTGEAV
jgi:putative transposase